MQDWRPARCFPARSLCSDMAGGARADAASNAISANFSCAMSLIQRPPFCIKGGLYIVQLAIPLATPPPRHLGQCLPCGPSQPMAVRALKLPASVPKAVRRGCRSGSGGAKSTQRRRPERPACSTRPPRVGSASRQGVAGASRQAAAGRACGEAAPHGLEMPHVSAEAAARRAARPGRVRCPPWRHRRGARRSLRMCTTGSASAGRFKRGGRRPQVQGGRHSRRCPARMPACGHACAGAPARSRPAG